MNAWFCTFLFMLLVNQQLGLRAADVDGIYDL